MLPILYALFRRKTVKCPFFLTVFFTIAYALPTLWLVPEQPPIVSALVSWLSRFRRGLTRFAPSGLCVCLIGSARTRPETISRAFVRPHQHRALSQARTCTTRKKAHPVLGYFRVPSGALPPNPPDIWLSTNGMKNAPGVPLGANGRRRYARTAAVEDRAHLASPPNAAAMVGWGLPHHPLSGREYRIRAPFTDYR